MILTDNPLFIECSSHSEDPQTLDASVQKLVATRPGARDLFTSALHI